ncbi:MAG: glycosyltransferase, partial [Blastocatellia bacterium]
MATPIILTCQHSVAFGGVQHAMFDIAKHIDRTRFEPIVICSPGGELSGWLAEQDVRVRPVGAGEYLRYSHRQPVGTIKDVLAVTREIIRLAQSEGVRVVHTFDGMLFFAASLARLRLRDLKVIWLDCGFDIYPYHFRVVMRWCFRHAALVGAITRIRQEQLWAEGLDPAKSAVFPCGTDFHLRVRRVSPLTSTAQRDTIRVGIVGRIVPIKNFEMFLQAARIVADKHPRVRFCIVGSKGLLDSELEYFRRIEGLVASLNLTERLIFRAPAPDLAQVLEGFDLLVSSSHLETFGRTLVEAMALSKPVVATAVGGVPEVVADGEVGYLVPPGDVQAMA